MNNPNFLGSLLVIAFIDYIIALLVRAFSKEDNMPFNIFKTLAIVNTLLAIWSTALVLGAKLSVKIIMG